MYIGVLINITFAQHIINEYDYILHGIHTVHLYNIRLVHRGARASRSRISDSLYVRTILIKQYSMRDVVCRGEREGRPLVYTSYHVQHNNKDLISGARAR